MTMIDYLFVINPKSGNTDKSKIKHFIEKAFAKNKKEYLLFHTNGKNDPERLIGILKEKNIKHVIACGGDGTVNMVASCLQKQHILGILPLGSANGLATELDIEEDVELALEIVLRGNYIHMDCIEINGKYNCLHLSDIGFNAKMIREFEKLQERGMLAYAKAFFQSLRDKTKGRYSIQLPNKKFEVEAEMIVFANASQYGTGAIINPGSAVNDGSFEIVIFKPIPLTQLPSLTFNSFLGNIKDSDFVEIYKTTKAEISCSQADLLQVDGEIKGDVEKVTAEIKPASIKVLC